MVGLHLSKRFLRINAIPIIPGHTSWIVLCDIDAENFEYLIEGLNPFDMSAVPASRISIGQCRLFRDLPTFPYIH